MNPEKAGREREFFEAIPQSDPHHVPDAAEKKQRRKQRRNSKLLKHQFQYPLFAE